jgi:hypothetical protein
MAGAAEITLKRAASRASLEEPVVSISSSDIRIRMDVIHEEEPALVATGTGTNDGTPTKQGRRIRITL